MKHVPIVASFGLQNKARHARIEDVCNTLCLVSVWQIAP